MEYALDSYGSFDEEQEILATEARKKEEVKKLNLIEEREIHCRLKCITDTFLKLSSTHKKQFLLCVIKNIDCLDSILRIISYTAALYGKLGAYAYVSPECRTLSEQIVIDHDRTLVEEDIQEIMDNHLKWIAALPIPQKIFLALDLIQMTGGSLARRVYIPIVTFYNRKAKEYEQRRIETGEKDTQKILDEPEPDDSDKYPRDHPLTIEVEKMRKKWDEVILKYRREVFGTEFSSTRRKSKEEKPAKDKKDVGAKEKRLKKVKEDMKTSKKGQADGNDWIQMLPIWIVKKILNYMDLKTLQSLKRVNQYWAYACDSLIKDRHARSFLDEAIERLSSEVNSDILNKYLNTSKIPGKPKPASPREKRLKCLMSRGAVCEKLRPVIKKSQEVRTNLVTSIPKTEDIIDPIDKIVAQPRLIRDDLMLYKPYPCILKDVNIVIDVYQAVQKHRDTLSYTLSGQLSDTFSMSEANLADW